jgi:hypothetical protein
MQEITPFLWFDGKAEEAMNFYVSIFKNSRILGANRFQLDGQEFFVLDGGPQFTFSPAADFQHLSPRRFHHHAPTIFIIMHPPFSPSCTHRFHDHSPTLWFSLFSF